MSIPPAGVHPLGFWEEANTDPFEGVVAVPARAIDADTGEITDLLATYTPADGMIVEAFRVERGSGPSVMTIGQTVREVKHTDPSSLAEIRARGREPIDELERLGIVRLDGVTAESNAEDESQVDFDLTYIDLTTPEHDAKQNTFPVSRQRQ